MKRLWLLFQYLNWWKRPPVKMSQYFLKPYNIFRWDTNVKVYLFNYATKFDLKNATGVDTSELVAKSHLASLKAKVDKIDVGKLKPVPDDLSKLRRNVVHNEVVKKLRMINWFKSNNADKKSLIIVDLLKKRL